VESTALAYTRLTAELADAHLTQLHFHIGTRLKAQKHIFYQFSLQLYKIVFNVWAVDILKLHPFKVWDLRRPPAESGLVIIEDDETAAEAPIKKKTKKTNWEKLKAQSAIPRIDATGQRWSPAIGKYQVRGTKLLKKFRADLVIFKNVQIALIPQ
jgi:hypothetical protein